ncbi:MAG: hypothetical protein R2909_11560 [Gemmatimonadales bacterium]
MAIGVSLAAHLALFWVRIGAWLPPIPQPLPEQTYLIPLGTEGERAFEMRYETVSGGGRPQPVRTSGIAAVPREETGPPEEPEPVDTSSAVVAEAPPRAAVDTAPSDPGPGRGTGRLGPAMGDGNLWVRALPLPPRELAHAVTRTQAELVDSAVTAIVQVYIDSVLNAEPADAPLPSWVARVGDNQVGVDSKWIYLGPIKIPTALVAAFLPINISSAATSDYTRFRALQQMREDVARAAQRAQTMDDFKRAIRELRAQREREREFEKNQRTPPKQPASDSVPIPDLS